jgi:hypothetical protein
MADEDEVDFDEDELSDESYAPPEIVIQRANPPAWVPVALAMVIIANAVTWAVIASKCFSASNDVQALTEGFFNDTSAVQVSQVANQVLVQQVAWVAVGFGVTATSIAFALLALSGWQNTR